MSALVEMWIGIILIFVSGMMLGADIRNQQYEKKRKVSRRSSPSFLGVNCGHQIRPIIEAGGTINPCVEEAQRLHEEELRKRKEAFNHRIRIAPEDRTKKTVYIQCRNGRPVAMKEIYNGKGV